MSYSENPYQAPHNVGVPQPGGPPNVAGKLKGPAIALLILAPISIIGMIVDFGFRIININAGNVNAFGNAPAFAKGAVVGAYIGAGVDLVSVLCQIVVIVGAINMLKVKSFATAKTACMISVVPCLTGCCILGIPFGIWGLVVLNDSNVKAAFHVAN